MNARKQVMMGKPTYEKECNKGKEGRKKERLEERMNEKKIWTD